jgi:hypothetical protein
MKQYYRISPRGFANEDAIISASTPAEIEYAESLVAKYTNDPNAWGERITRKEAEQITAANRKAERNGKSNYCNPAGATEIVAAAECIEEDMRLDIGLDFYGRNE